MSRTGITSKGQDITNETNDNYHAIRIAFELLLFLKLFHAIRRAFKLIIRF